MHMISGALIGILGMADFDAGFYEFVCVVQLSHLPKWALDNMCVWPSFCCKQADTLQLPVCRVCSSYRDARAKVIDCFHGALFTAAGASS